MKKLVKMLSSVTIVMVIFLVACKKEEATPISPPTLSSSVGTNITINSADITVSVSTIGSGKVSDYGLVYATKDNPTTSDTKMAIGSSLTSSTSKTVTIENLTPGTMYYARTYLTNENATYYGTSVSFSTGALKMGVVTTGIASKITASTFDVAGKLTDVGTGSVSGLGHCYSETVQIPTIADSKIDGGVAASPVDYLSSIPTLKEGTTYYVRAFVTNPAGTAYGEVITVKTLKMATVTTGASSNIKATAFDMAGKLTDLGSGGITALGHCYSETVATPTLADSKIDGGAATAVKDYSSAIPSLKSGTTYYVRAFVTNPAGTKYGEVVTVKTITAELATVRTFNASGILSTSAKIDGTIDKAGTTSITEYGHCYSSTNQTPTVADSKTKLTASGSFPLNFSSDLSALTANTTYYVRAYATTSVGTGYGTVATFKTSDATNDLVLISSVTITVPRGADYSSESQVNLLNLTTGKKYKFSEGAANAQDVDLLFKLYSNSTIYNSDPMQMHSPANVLNDNPYWGNFVTTLIAQNWSVYKGTKLGSLSSSSYPPATWWGKINTLTDLNTVISNSYITLYSTDYDVVSSGGDLKDSNLYIFQTKEGKKGIIRITDGGKKATSYTVTIDIKVQK